MKHARTPTAHLTGVRELASSCGAKPTTLTEGTRIEAGNETRQEKSGAATEADVSFAGGVAGKPREAAIADN